MTKLRNLLHVADPLEHEAPHDDAERERMRRRIIAATRTGDAPRSQARRKFSAVMMTAAAAMVAVGIIIGAQVWWRDGAVVQAAVRFEVRLAEETAAPGLQAARVSSTRVVYLHREAVVTNGDIAGSRVVQGATPSQFWIDVQFTAAGAQKMRDATRTHIGKPVAILIDGDVVMAPTVKSPIGAAAMITGDYTQADAERIARGIAASP